MDAFVRRGARARCALVLLVTCLLGIASTDAAIAHRPSHERTLASSRATVARNATVSKRMGPSGGLLRARGGASLYVPPDVIRRRGLVSIRRLAGGRFDFHIATSWRGTVAVTMPRVSRSEVVSHRIDDVWLPEGKPGQRTVWVTHLSIFDTIKAKARAAVCFLQLSRAKIAACLATKLPGKVTKDVANWIAEKLGQNCAAALISNGVLAPVATLWEEACRDKAGEGDFHFPSGPQPNPTPTPVPPAVAPTPEPTPAPVPTPAPSPMWNEQQGSLGANTFQNPSNASGVGPKIAPYQWVSVSCKVLAPQIQSANPDGYWYRVASSPWNNAFYAVANTFWNGDVPGQRPYTHNTDWAVADC